MSGFVVRPSARARAASKRAGQLPTIASIAGSGIQSIEFARRRAPATRSNAAAISPGVVSRPGVVSAVRLPQVASSTVAAVTIAATV